MICTVICQQLKIWIGIKQTIPWRQSIISIFLYFSYFIWHSITRQSFSFMNYKTKFLMKYNTKLCHVIGGYSAKGFYMRAGALTQVCRAWQKIHTWYIYLLTIFFKQCDLSVFKQENIKYYSAINLRFWKVIIMKKKVKKVKIP